MFSLREALLLLAGNAVGFYFYLNSSFADVTEPSIVSARPRKLPNWLFLGLTETWSSKILALKRKNPFSSGSYMLLWSYILVLLSAAWLSSSATWLTTYGKRLPWKCCGASELLSALLETVGGLSLSLFCICSSSPGSELLITISPWLLSVSTCWSSSSSDSSTALNWC